MLRTHHTTSKWQLAGALILISVVWCSMALAQCVYADSIENSSVHDTSDCVLHDNNPIKNDKDCIDCSSSLVTLTSQESSFSHKFQYDNDDQPSFAALISLYEPRNVTDFACNTDVPIQSKNRYFPPIYLKNCVFLN